MSFLSKLNINRNSLRRVKYRLSDDFKLIKYQTSLFQRKISDLSSNVNNDAITKEKVENDGIFTKNGSDIQNTKISTLKPLKIVFAVSEVGEDAYAGDYFTALELGEALKNFNWEISFLSRNGPGYWYKIDDDVDVLISLLDIYDPRRIKCSNKSLIKIAWPRNWFDRWVSHPGFRSYDMIFAPSKIALEYITEKTNKKPFLLPIATNPARFNGSVPQKNEYLSDYCFTGSYWDYPRDIVEMLEPEKLTYKFKLYGKNWDKIGKFKNITRVL